MPYVNGKRVSNEEWSRLYGSFAPLHTGPNGENPASPPELDEEVAAPKAAKKQKAGSNRSKTTTKARKAAVADALGVKPDSEQLADVDVSGIDDDAEEATEQEAE